MIVKINGEDFDTKNLEIVRGNATYRIEDWDWKINNELNNTALKITSEEINSMGATMLSISPFALSGMILNIDAIKIG